MKKIKIPKIEFLSENILHKAKYFLVFILSIIIVLTIIKSTYAYETSNVLSELNININDDITTTTTNDIDDFLKNPYKGYCSEDPYTQTTKEIKWKDHIDKYATEGYLRLNWYLFYKDSFKGPKDATNYKDEAYDWSSLYTLIKLYADHNMQLRFGVMTVNTTSTDSLMSTYESGPLNDYTKITLTELKMPYGSKIPVADYIPSIQKDDKNNVTLMCGDVDCKSYDTSTADYNEYTMKTVSKNEDIYKSRNITPMWMFKGIPNGYDENGNPTYDENSVEWFLEKKNFQWIPKWDDQNLINNINDFITAMSNYLKTEEYNGKKLIEYISFIEARSYGNFGENHNANIIMGMYNNELRNPFKCGYLDTTKHNGSYVYEKDENENIKYKYPENCYYTKNDGTSSKIIGGYSWHNNNWTQPSIRYSNNISFDYYYDKYLSSYLKAFEDTNVKIVVNWMPESDILYNYYDGGYKITGFFENLLKNHNGYLTTRTDSVFLSDWGDAKQLYSAHGTAPTSFEYVINSYKTYYNNKSQNELKDKFTCTDVNDCLTDYFVNIVENGRVSYMDYNYILHDYYENRLNNISDKYQLDLDYLGNSLGYHFIMKNAKYTNKVFIGDNDKNNLNVDLNFVNNGVTYLYDKDDTKVYLGFIKTDGNGNIEYDENGNSVIINKYLTEIDPTTWKSSLDLTGNRDSTNENNFIPESVKLNINNIDTGKYILAIGIFTNFDEEKPTIKLGNTGGTEDNWYALGEIEVKKVDVLSFPDYISIENTDEINYIKNIPADTTVAEMKELINTSGEITITNQYNEELKPTDKIGTGCKINIKLTKETKKYTVIILGDVNGDGTNTITDVAKLFQHYRKTKVIPEAEKYYILAGDVKKDDEIKLTDISKLFQYIRKKIASIN